MDLDDLETISKRWPQSAELVAKVGLLHSTATDLPWERFREPLACVTVDAAAPNDQPRLEAVDAALFRAWAQHVCFSVRARMLNLERGVLHELVHGRILPSAVLLRSHLESAALAALCLAEVRESSRTGDLVAICKLIPKVLFGTSLHKHARTCETVADMLSLVEGTTIKICRAVEELDNLLCPEGGGTRMALTYSLLCEFSHPNLRGTRDFASICELPERQGWVIEYGPHGSFDFELCDMVLKTLLRCMAAGYGATEMLRTWRSVDQTGHIELLGPEEFELQRIWGSFFRYVHEWSL
jgi:hypothetical protein